MKDLILIFCLLLELGFTTGWSSDSGDSSNWRVIWFPPNDTMRSWNWVEESKNDWNTMKVFPVDYSQKFPDQVKRWELGVVSMKNPGKALTLRLDNPHSGSTIAFAWMPGEFRDGIDRLEALGEGTFLCAILGDGKRYSNVATVTIRHDYDPSNASVIRLVAVQPYGKDDPIKYIGAWIVAPSPVDPHFGTEATRCPSWEINGTWRIAPGDLNGCIGTLPAGIAWGEVYDIGYKASFKRTGPITLCLGGYEPPILPFTEAKVRLRLADEVYNFVGIPLTSQQREYIEASGMSRSGANSKIAPLSKIYISDAFDIRVDKAAMDRFDQAFRP